MSRRHLDEPLLDAARACERAAKRLRDAVQHEDVWGVDRLRDVMRAQAELGETSKPVSSEITALLPKFLEDKRDKPSPKEGFCVCGHAVTLHVNSANECAGAVVRDGQLGNCPCRQVV